MAKVKVFVYAANADADTDADISSPDIRPGSLKGEEFWWEDLMTILNGTE